MSKGLGARIATMGTKPYDEELEYITLNGSWVYMPMGGSHIEKTAYKFSARISTSTTGTRVFMAAYPWFGQGNGHFKSSNKESTTEITPGVMYDILVDGSGRFYVDGSLVLTDALDASAALYLFAFNANKGYAWIGNVGRFVYEKTDGSSKVVECTPCIKDGVVGFWDSVSESLVTDSSFVAGPRK